MFEDEKFVTLKGFPLILLLIRAFILLYNNFYFLFLKLLFLLVIYIRSAYRKARSKAKYTESQIVCYPPEDPRGAVDKTRAKGVSRHVSESVFDTEPPHR